MFVMSHLKGFVVEAGRGAIICAAVMAPCLYTKGCIFRSV
uniref:Uncharacterized protein n=1 Tax=Anguilla anguilla TaxID=7936 RepID=A0A0E9UX11_ANGAN